MIDIVCPSFLHQKVFLNMTLLNTKHQCSAVGNVMTSPVLIAPLDQDTSSPPTSPERAETALLHFPFTAVQSSQNCSRPLDQVSKIPLHISIYFVKTHANEILLISDTCKLLTQNLTVCFFLWCTLFYKCIYMIFFGVFRPLLPRVFKKVGLPLSSCLLSVWEKQRHDH